MTIAIKRVYEEAAPIDGYRILVDRLWPRGVSREDAKIDEWLKDIAPSNDLRKWFHHEPEKWDEFQRRYFTELDENSEPLKTLGDRIEHHPRVTLVFSAKDADRNNAVVLRDYLERDSKRGLGGKDRSHGFGKKPNPSYGLNSKQFHLSTGAISPYNGLGICAGRTEPHGFGKKPKPSCGLSLRECRPWILIDSHSSLMLEGIVCRRIAVRLHGQAFRNPEKGA